MSIKDILSAKGYCQCLYEMESELPSTVDCFTVCQGQLELLHLRRSQYCNKLCDEWEKRGVDGAPSFMEVAQKLFDEKYIQLDNKEKLVFDDKFSNSNN